MGRARLIAGWRLTAGGCDTHVSGHSRPRRSSSCPDAHGGVSLDGVSKIVSIALVEDVPLGDYVIIHVGYALARIDPEEAERTLALMREAAVPGSAAYGCAMKYVNEYRDGALAAQIAADHRAPRRTRIAAIGSWSSAAAIPTPSRATASRICCRPTSRMIHGPGCPVCVLPMGRIDEHPAWRMRPEVTLCTYADLMRVPASRGASLLKAKAAGADIRMVYSSLDASASPRPSRSRRWCSSPSASRPRRRRRRVAIALAAKQAADEFQRVLQPRADAAGDARDPRSPGRPDERRSRSRASSAPRMSPP